MSKAIETIGKQLNIAELSDWEQVSPHEVLRLPRAGNVTLDKVRLYLANHGCTLRDDATPEAWIDALTDDAAPVPSDFIVLIDNQEKNPFTFAAISHDADRNNRKMAVQTRVVSLGASHADYSIAGYQGQVAIERKSLEDAIGTFSACGERRERFERELEYLSGIQCAAIVVECTRGELYGSVVSRGKRTEQQLARNLQRSVAAWEQDYRVPFVFCDSRELAELECFRRLARFYRKAMEESARVEPTTSLDTSLEQLAQLIASL